jgi:isoprenylcysteine carboxyl methyltransferase (ICMT) family protein YpbQ
MAITFSILNAVLLWWRIRIENDVLTERGHTT